MIKRPAAASLFWSRVRESNPPLRLGKRPYYRYTNPAYLCRVIITYKREKIKRKSSAGIIIPHRLSDAAEFIVL